MKVAWIGVLAISVAALADAAVVPAAAATAHVRQSVTIEGLVSEVHVARNGKETFIDIGGLHQIFTGIIFERSMPAGGNVEELNGRTVDITRTNQVYAGKPEIIITSRDQIRAR